MSRLALTLIVLMLSACTDEVSDRADCADYGFRPGTVAFAQCMQNLDIRRKDAVATIFDQPRHVSCMNIGGIVTCQ